MPGGGTGWCLLRRLDRHKTRTNKSSWCSEWQEKVVTRDEKLCSLVEACGNTLWVLGKMGKAEANFTDRTLRLSLDELESAIDTVRDELVGVSD
jgi:hypothetical protein